MAGVIEAKVRVQGDPAALQAFRRVANTRLDEEFEHEYRELHTANELDWRIKARRGIPFPAFAAASAEFPNLLVEIEWRRRDDGSTGQALVQAGRLVTQDARAAETPGELLLSVRAAADGTIGLALALRRRRDGSWIGYALTDTEHAFFQLAARPGGHELLASDGVEPEWAERWTIGPEGTAHETLATPEPIADDLLDDLDAVARGFADDWVWFEEAPEEETAVERHRFELYGYRVRPANLRAEKLKRVMGAEAGGLVFESLDADARRAAALVATHWLRTAGNA